MHGSKAYEISFRLQDGMISHLTCECPCGYNCKHEVATLLQLHETLKLVAEKYQKEYTDSRYFAIVDKLAFLSFAITHNDGATVELR